MPVKVTVKIKADEKRYKQDFLHYENTDGILSLDTGDPRLKKMVEEAISNFKGTPEEISVKADFIWDI